MQRAIERVDDLSVSEFRANFLEKNRPVIIKWRDGPAAERRADPSCWTELIKSKCGGNVVSVKKFNRTLAAPDEQVTMKLEEYLQIVHTGQSAFPRYYLKNRPLAEIVPQLLDTVPLPPHVDRGGVSEAAFKRSSHIYIGRDAQTGMHFHANEEAISLVLQGQKEFLLFAPSETRNLYANPWYTWLRFGVNQSNLMFWKNEVVNGPFRRFDAARGYRCSLGPGEMLFIPAHWWHAVYTTDQPTVMFVYWFRSRVRRWWGTPQAFRVFFHEAVGNINRGMARVRRRVSRSRAR